MSERTFYKMLVLSMAFHLVFLAVVSLTVKKTSRPINPFLSSYSVNLVEDISGSPKDGSERPLPRRAPERLSQAEKRRLATKKPGPAAQPKGLEEHLRSVAPKRLPSKETTGTTKDELRRLDERIQEMKRRASTSDSQAEPSRGMRGSEGLSGTGSAHGTEQNAALVRYLGAVRDRIESAWHIPFASGAKKHLEAKVTVTIRRDGRIVDIIMEKRSGNRAYDESVLRVLRAIDPLPPIPASVEDPLEVEMTLRPEGVS